MTTRACFRSGDATRVLKSFITGLAAAALLLAGSLTAQAQQGARVYRIGFVSPISPGPTIAAFRQGLREVGYIEGKNVIVEARFAEGQVERLPQLIADVLRLKVDVLVIGSEVGVLAAKKATTTVPIVFAGVSDPVAAGIVASLARPGGNITGFTFGIGGMGFAGKWVELLKEAVPRSSNVAVLSNSADPQTAPLLLEVQAAARNLNVKLSVFDAVDHASLDRSLSAIGASGAQGIIVTNSPLFAASRAKLVQFAADKRLPAMYFFKLFVDAGGLMSYGGSLEDTYRRAPIYVDKILKGAKPDDLPIEQPTRIELAINMKAAKAIGLTIPQRLLLRADHVID